MAMSMMPTIVTTRCEIISKISCGAQKWQKKRVAISTRSSCDEMQLHSR